MRCRMFSWCQRDKKVLPLITVTDCSDFIDSGYRNLSSSEGKKLDENQLELFDATKEGKLDAVRQILDQGVDLDGCVNDLNQNPIQVAASMGHLEVLHLLLLHHTWSPLQINKAFLSAASRSQWTTVLHLIDHTEEADFNAENSFGITVFQMSLADNADQITTKMMMREFGGPDLDHRDDLGRSAVHFAAMNRDPKFVASMLDSGFDIEARDDSWRTPLHYASRSGGSRTAMEIMGRGGNVWAKDVTGLKPIDDLMPETMFSYLDSLVEVSSECGQVQVKLGFLRPELDGSECDRIAYLLRSPVHAQVLRHPVVASFVHLKWKKIRIFFTVNFFIHFAYVIFTSAYVVSVIPSLGANNTTVNANDVRSGPEILLHISQSFLVITIALQIIILIANCSKTSVRLALDLLDLSLGTLVLFFDTWLFPDWKHGFLLLWPTTAWLNLAMLTGSYPALAEIAVAFSGLVWTYFTVLFPFGFILLTGCVMSFFLAHHEKNQSEVSFSESAISTLVMSTGRHLEPVIDIARIVPSGMKPFAMIFGLGFIFIVGLVFSNLLTALAVCRLQESPRQEHGYFVLAESVCAFDAFCTAPTRMQKTLSRFCECHGYNLGCCCDFFPFRFLQWLLKKLQRHTGVLPDNRVGSEDDVLQLNLQTGVAKTSISACKLPQDVISSFRKVLGRKVEEQRDLKMAATMEELKKGLVKVEELNQEVKNNVRSLERQLETAINLLRDQVVALDTIDIHEC